MGSAWARPAARRGGGAGGAARGHRGGSATWGGQLLLSNAETGLKHTGRIPQKTSRILEGKEKYLVSRCLRFSGAQAPGDRAQAGYSAAAHGAARRPGDRLVRNLQLVFKKRVSWLGPHRRPGSLLVGFIPVFLSSWGAGGTPTVGGLGDGGSGDPGHGGGRGGCGGWGGEGL